MSQINPYQPPRSQVADVAAAAVAGIFVEGGRAVEAGHGWTWIAAAFDLFKKRPGAWIVITIILGVIMILVNLLPIVGWAEPAAQSDRDRPRVNGPEPYRRQVRTVAHDQQNRLSGAHTERKQTACGTGHARRELLAGDACLVADKGDASRITPVQDARRQVHSVDAPDDEVVARLHAAGEHDAATALGAR